MKRLLAPLLLVLGGCATWSDEGYYDRGYARHPYYDPYYDDYGYVSRHPGGWSASAHYYDLYDPYSSLFAPLGYLYDPWFHDRYRFGVDLYPSRYWSFAFYGGRPWHHSPWYGGYGLYRPYGWSSPAQPVAGSAQAATRELAAELAAHGPPPPDILVRAGSVALPDEGGSAVLGSMAVAADSTRGDRLQAGSGRPVGAIPELQGSAVRAPHAAAWPTTTAGPAWGEPRSGSALQPAAGSALPAWQRAPVRSAPEPHWSEPRRAREIQGWNNQRAPAAASQPRFEAPRFERGPDFGRRFEAPELRHERGATQTREE